MKFMKTAAVSLAVLLLLASCGASEERGRIREQ